MELKTSLVMMLFLAVACQARTNSIKPTTVSLPNASSRINQALKGLFSYYWKVDPLAKNIGFFFACGQIGGQGSTYKWDECSCNYRQSCLDCYRWWDAVALESTATYGIYTKTKNHSHIPQTIFAHSPYNAGWNAVTGCTYIDDFAWYGIAYLRVYDWLKNDKWLNSSLDLYNWAWKYGWDEPCGGFWWDTCPTERFKNSITIMEMLHFSSKLAYMFPNETRYLHDAQRIWDWVFSFDNGYGLMSDEYLVSTGAIPEKCCNATTRDPARKCHKSKLSGTSYNQGLLLSSSAQLYKVTKDAAYLKVGLRALAAVIENYTTPDGVLADEPRTYQTYNGYQCWGGIDPGGDWYSFNGIFMLHLGYFTDLLAEETGLLSKENITSILSFVSRTSDSAWSKSAVWPPFNGSDVCDIGPKLNDTFPKFHWWWNREVTEQILPPDPGLFLKKTHLRCFGNNTQLWQGMTGSEDACAGNCTNNTACSKYLYQTDQLAVPGTDCWIWSYNRSDHICNGTDSDFNVGVKRPLGNATCAGRCGSKEPQNLTHGVCYCDADCTKHLDCCIDYADQCVKEKYLSCKGLCNTSQAQAIMGGGYCWCFSGCNPWFTDNNSSGSCCPDYPQQCQAVTMPKMCLDGRTQGSAVNLFLAHLKITEVAQNAGIL